MRQALQRDRALYELKTPCRRTSRRVAIGDVLDRAPRSCAMASGVWQRRLLQVVRPSRSFKEDIPRAVYCPPSGKLEITEAQQRSVASASLLGFSLSRKRKALSLDDYAG